MLQKNRVSLRISWKPGSLPPGEYPTLRLIIPCYCPILTILRFKKCAFYCKDCTVPDLLFVNNHFNSFRQARLFHPVYSTFATISQRIVVQGHCCPLDISPRTQWSKETCVEYISFKHKCMFILSFFSFFNHLISL